MYPVCRGIKYRLIEDLEGILIQSPVYSHLDHGPSGIRLHDLSGKKHLVRRQFHIVSPVCKSKHLFHTAYIIRHRSYKNLSCIYCRCIPVDPFPLEPVKDICCLVKRSLLCTVEHHNSIGQLFKMINMGPVAGKLRHPVTYGPYKA